MEPCPSAQLHPPSSDYLQRLLEQSPGSSSLHCSSVRSRSVVGLVDAPSPAEWRPLEHGSEMARAPMLPSKKG